MRTRALVESSFIGFDDRRWTKPTREALPPPTTPPTPPSPDFLPCEFWNASRGQIDALRQCVPCTKWFGDYRLRA